MRGYVFKTIEVTKKKNLGLLHRNSNQLHKVNFILLLKKINIIKIKKEQDIIN